MSTYNFDLRTVLMSLFVLFICLLLPESSDAAGAVVNTGDTGLGATGTSMGHVGEKVGKNFQYVAIAVGIIFAVVGIMKMVNSKEGRSSAGVGFGMFIAGAALTSIIATQGTVSESLFGADKTETIMTTLGH